jgi:DNA-binding transcriptional LysR family regulator
MGIAPLPDVAAEAERAGGRLARLAWTDALLKVAGHLVWNPQAAENPAIRVFLEFCAETLGN